MLLRAGREGKLQVLMKAWQIMDVRFQDSAIQRIRQSIFATVKVPIAKPVLALRYE